MNYMIKMARTAQEFEGIFELNYDTFVEEIPQHHENDEKKLIDKFHGENDYVICKLDDEIIGMIALRDKRPFSLDLKLGMIENHLDIKFEKPCEIRLLSVKKKFRNGRVFASITGALIRFCLYKGYDIAFISGTTRQTKLYKHLGFEAFAGLVGKEDAWYQPMYLTKTMFYEKEHLKSLSKLHSFLPGPVEVGTDIQFVFKSQPEWHRSEEHKQIVQKVVSKLKRLVNVRNVSILSGTGTVANDAVAAHLSSINTKGLIISNGEFGERLIDHANRFGLPFDKLTYDWGKPYSIDEIKTLFETNHYDWIWFVHCETSTGMINDFYPIQELCLQYSAKICIDAISSIGAVPLNLEKVYLASGVSGKALGAITGLSFVLFNEIEETSKSVPRYLDLLHYQNCQGVPFSQNSYLFKALDIALNKFNKPTFFNLRESLFSYVFDTLEEQGFTLVVDKHQSSPCVLTIAFPKEMNVMDIGLDLFLNGFQVHFRNRYLIERNWIQIALMSSYEDNEVITKLLSSLHNLIKKNSILSA